MHVIAGVVALLHVAVLFSAAFLLPGPDDGETFLAITLGVTHAEIALLSVWAVFSSKPIGLRLLLSPLGVIVVAAVFCAYVIRTNGPKEVCVVSTIALFLQWALTQIPFWLTKRSGWVITAAADNVPMTAQASQFHLRHLFMWTTAIAVLFAIGNAASGLLGTVTNDFGQWVGFFGIVTIANILMAGPFIWATLTRYATLIWTGIAIASFGMLTPLEATFFSQLSVSGKLLDDGLRFIFIISLVHVVTIVSALFVTRGYGQRLIRAEAGDGSINKSSQ